MPDFTIVETRSISGKGILQIPDANRLDRAFILYSDVVRKPTSEYKNFNYNPAKSLYGKICLMNNDYVVGQLSIEFESQRWDFIPDVNAETLLAIQCAYKGVLQTFANLGNALAGTPGSIGLVVTTIDNNIVDYAPIRNSSSSLQLVCYADAGIQLSLQSLAPDKCGTDTTPPIPPAEPPITKPAPIPAGQVFSNSLPYAPSLGNPNVGDSGNTQPLAMDEPAPAPTQGIACNKYRVTLAWQAANSLPNSPPLDETFPITLWGVLGAISIGPGGNTLLISCQGNAETSPCGAIQVVTISPGGSGFMNASYTYVAL